MEEIRHHIERLRTFAQHHLQLGSPRDQGTIESVYSLFERWIDRRLPEPEHYEACLRCLLGELIVLLSAIHGFLRRVQDDELRDLILVQWRRARETQWPKHQFEAIVGAALRDLGRSDLKSHVVTEKILPELQQRLTATSDQEDKEAILRSFVERRVTESLPREMPVRGVDIIRLGIPPSPRVGEILDELRGYFRETGASREQLLERAKEIIALPPSDSRP